MTNQIIKAAFKKVENETGKESVNGISEFLSEYFLENFKYSISTKSITRYYKGESSPNHQICDYLAQYLGYDGYKTFLAWNSPPSKVEVTSNLKANFPLSIKTNLVIISIFILVIVTSGYIGFSNAGKECMRWEEDHYIKTACTGAMNETKLVPYLYNNFRKIEVSDTTTFFKRGKVQVWYDKSDKELEFFTAPGLHPINRKTLKPISEYMIEKYIRN